MIEKKAKKREPNKHCRGFTLVEVLVVLLLLGTIGVVIASRVSSTGLYSVKSEAAALKSHLRYAQTMAMSTNLIWGLSIGSKQYSLFRDNNTSDTVILPGAESDPVVLPGNAPSLSSAGPIRFNGMGTPVDAGGNAIASNATITVSMDGESETITITKNTGFIP